MKEKRRSMIFILAVSLMVFIAAPISPVMAGETGITKDKIKIGLYTPMTGPIAGLGKSLLAGINTYLNIVKEKGGIHGRNIELLVEDDAYQPAKTVAATKKLVEMDEVFALVSATGAPTTLAVLDYLEENKVPLICPFAPVSQLVDPFKKNVFTITPGFFRQYYFIADYAVRVLGAKKVCSIGQAGSPSGVNAIRARLSEAGQSLVAYEEYKIGETDFSSLILKLKSMDTDFCIIGTVTRPGALIAKEIQKQGWKTKHGFMSHCTIIDPEFIRLASGAAEGFLALEIMKSSFGDDPEVVEFRKRLKKYYPKIEPGMFAMHGYISTMIFCEAMKKAGPEPTREKLIAALESMNGVDKGFMAPLTFSPTQHQGNMNARVSQVKNGKWTPITDWMKLPDRVK